MDDQISRKAAIDVMLMAIDDDWEPDYATDRMNDLPSAQQEQRWIPCSETVDIPGHEILACDKYGEEMFGYLAYEDEQWLCESDGYIMYDPIAWREKPEPYWEEGSQNG